jgi:transposase-like protein
MPAAWSSSNSSKRTKAAFKVFQGTTWQRCRVHTTRNLLARVPKPQQSRLATLLRDAFTAPNAEKAHATWRAIADQARSAHPKLAEAMEEAESDVLAYMDFPAAHRVKPHSTNGLERLNKEVKRRADVAGIFPNEASIVRLVGAVLLEANDEWQLQHRYLSMEAFANVNTVDEEIDRFALAPPATSQLVTPPAA